MRLLLTLLLVFTTTLFANIAKITAIKGDATVLRDSKTINLSIGFLLEEKDQITTSKDARLQLQFQDKTVISLGKDSVFNIEEYFFDEKQAEKTKASFKVPKGIFKSITGRIGKINPSKFKFKTKSASIGIRGTVFFGKVTPVTPGRPPVPDQIACTSGRIAVTTPTGMVEVPAGQFTTVVVNQPPAPPKPLPPQQAASLNESSGASANETESGTTEQTVEQEKQQPVDDEGTNQPAEENNDGTATEEEGNDNPPADEENNDGTTTEESGNDNPPADENNNDGTTIDEGENDSPTLDDTNNDAITDEGDTNGVDTLGDTPDGGTTGTIGAIDGDGLETADTDIAPVVVDPDVVEPVAIPDVNVNDVTDLVDETTDDANDVLVEETQSTTNDTLTDSVTDSTTDSVTDSTSDPVTDPITTPTTLKTATYSVFHSAEIEDSVYMDNLILNRITTQESHEPIYGSQYDSTGSITSRGTIDITDGQLNGTSTIYLYNEYDGSALDYYLSDGMQDSLTTDYFSTIPQLNYPEATYTGVNHIYKYTSSGVFGDDIYNGNDKDIFIDSKQEFFVALEDNWEYNGVYTSSYIDPLTGITINYTDYSTKYGAYHTLVGGEKADYTVLPSDGISAYVFPKDIYDYAYNTGTTQTYGLDDTSGFAGSDNVYDIATIFNQSDFYNYVGYSDDYYGSTKFELSTYTTYVNWKNKNLLDYSIGLYYDSYDYSFKVDGSIALGNITSDTDGKAKVNLTIKDFYQNSYYDSSLQANITTHIYEETDTSDFYVFGSEYQGIGGTVTYKDTSTGITNEDTYGAFRADGLNMENSTTPSGTSTLIGFATSNGIESTPYVDELTIVLDRATSITGTIKDTDLSTLSNITFGGDLGIDSAYITDDTFAALNFSGLSADEYLVNFGWLVANDTDLQTQTTTATDDGISWGLWGINTNASLTTNQIDVGFWVAGVNRVEDMIASLGSNFVGTYTGNVMGIVQGYTSGTYDVLDTLNSTMTLGFNFGAGTIDATLNAITTSSNQVIQATKNFTNADFTSGAVYSATNQIDSITGSFYNNGASTAGSFNFDVNGDTVSGVYKALKQ